MAIEIVKTEDGYKIQKLDNEKLRILQLTDVHIGGGFCSRKKDALAIDAVKKVITKANPDFVIVTGDISYPFPVIATKDNQKSAKMFADTLKELNVNWALTFGNHDTESFSKLDRNKLADFYMSYDNCFFSNRSGLFSFVRFKACFLLHLVIAP